MLEPWQIPLITMAVIAIVVFAIRRRNRSAPSESAESTESLDGVMTQLSDKTAELREVVRNLAAQGNRAGAVEAARPLATLMNLTPEQVVDQVENEKK